MASLPYMQLYVADYLADTYHLTTEEHGAYFLMLMNYWQKGKPLQYERIPSVIRMDKERFTKIEHTLMDFFIVDEDGFWVHERIEQDLQQVLEKSNKAKESAKKRWDKKPENKGDESDSNANAYPNAKRTVCHKDKIREDKIREDNKEIVKTKSFDDSIRLANYLLNNILKVKPSFKKPNIENWAKDIDKAIRIDKRTVQQLKDCMDWIYSPNGEFWQPNILSGEKLRHKFDVMDMQVIKKSTSKEALKLSEEAETWANVYRKKGLSDDEIIEKLKEGGYINE